MKKVIFVLALVGCWGVGNAQFTTVGGFEETNNNLRVNGRNFFLGENAGGQAVRAELGLDRSSDGNAYFDLIADQSNYNDFGIRLIRFADGRSSFTHRGDQPLVFKAADPGGTIEFTRQGDAVSLFVASDGKIGIGTSTPSKQLSINGDMESEEVEVKSDVADYVFSNDYKIMPLKELNLYIRKNGHLPNIQTQQDVEKNGGYVKLGDLSISLMEKVEELTIHLIKLNEKVEKLELENNNLKEILKIKK